MEVSEPMEPSGSAPVAGHGGEDDPQLLGRVAEQALLGDDAARAGA